MRRNSSKTSTIGIIITAVVLVIIIIISNIGTNQLQAVQTGANKIFMPVQSAFINWRQEPDSYLESIMGIDRVKKLNPIKDFLNNNIIVSFGSDAPCTSPDPISWMDKAVNNNNKDQRINIHDALRMCTYNGYYTSFDEDNRGSLEIGKIADMVILSENPYTYNEISKIKVEKLILSGKEYKSAKENIFKSIIKSIFSSNKF